MKSKDKSSLLIRNALISLQIYLLVFQTSPEPFEEDVVHPLSPSIHADPDAVQGKQAREALRGELGALSVLKVGPLSAQSGAPRKWRGDRQPSFMLVLEAGDTYPQYGLPVQMATLAFLEHPRSFSQTQLSLNGNRDVPRLHQGPQFFQHVGR